MEISVAGKTHIGMKRRLNEDSFLSSQDLGLYVVADGMGGHKAGEVASKMVIDTMTDYWRKVQTGSPPSLLHQIDEDYSKGAKHLINSISFANMIVHEAQKKPKYHRMGSTVSAVLIEKDQVWSANVGDSPVYLFRDGHLDLVSEEHSVEAEQKNMGMVDSKGSTNPMIKNMLTRVLGLNEQVDVYITPIKLEKGDIVVICSDGLTNYLSDKSIRMILGDFSISVERKVDILIDEANLGGGGDNISVILLEALEEKGWGKFKKRFMAKS